MGATKMQLLAYHEAGHAAIGTHLGRGVTGVHVAPEGERLPDHGTAEKPYAGICLTSRGGVNLDEIDARDPRTQGDRARMMDAVVLKMAGPEAEWIFDPDPLDFLPLFGSAFGRYDREEADELLAMLAPEEEERRTLEAFLRVRTRNLLRALWPGVKAIADALSERHSLTGAEVVALMFEAGASLGATARRLSKGCLKAPWEG